MHVDSVGMVLGLMKVRFRQSSAPQNVVTIQQHSISWALIGNTSSLVPPRRRQSKPLGTGPSNLCSDKTSSSSLSTKIQRSWEHSENLIQGSDYA